MMYFFLLYLFVVGFVALVYVICLKAFKIRRPIALAMGFGYALSVIAFGMLEMRNPCGDWFGPFFFWWLFDYPMGTIGIAICKPVFYALDFGACQNVMKILAMIVGQSIFGGLQYFVVGKIVEGVIDKRFNKMLSRFGKGGDE